MSKLSLTLCTFSVTGSVAGLFLTLGRLKHQSTTDVGVALTHFIQSGWVKNLTTGMLAFDIAQFFPSLNHHLLLLILNKVGFNPKVSIFFRNYLVGRKTKYLWIKFSSSFCNVDVGVGQGSALSSILSALYLSLIFHILEKHLKNLKISISFLSFVDNGLLISQHKSIQVLNVNLFCSYNIVFTFLTKFGLVVKHGKSEVFHFSRSHENFNPPSLDLSLLRGPTLSLKNT